MELKDKYEENELAKRREKKRVLKAIRDMQRVRQHKARKLARKKKGFKFSGKKYLDAVGTGLPSY